MKKTQRGSITTIVSLGISLVLLAGSIWLVFNRQLAADYYRAELLYDPTTEIAQLAETTTMTQKGKLYFYASEPVLEKTSQFNEECQRQEEGSSILGCYKAGKIFIYDVPDERLNGIEEVTAAHEMLHAAYERLGKAERAKVDSMVETEYQRLQSAEGGQLKERMQYYARTEPGERANELHSILATEVDSLSDELEVYFKRYFTNRKAIVKLHASYNDKFEELHANSTQLKTQLDTLSKEIDALTTSYNDAMLVLNNDITRFNDRASNGGFASQAEFQMVRTALVGRVDEGQRQREEIDAKANEYEQKRQAYNATVDESNSLTRSLDSRLAPAPSI